LKIRLANDTEGLKISDLIDYPDGLDWSRVYPYWLVAEKDERIVGCLSVALCRPIGILDQLAVDPDLGPHARGRAVRELIATGMTTLKADGASACVSMIPFHLKSYKRLLKKHFGAEVMTQGNIVMARLQWDS